MDSLAQVQRPAHGVAPTLITLTAREREAVQLDILIACQDSGRRPGRLSSATILRPFERVGIVRRPAAGGDAARAGVATTAVAVGLAGAAAVAGIALTAGIENLVKERSLFNPAGTKNVAKGVCLIVFFLPLGAAGGVVAGGIAAAVSSLLCCCACMRD